MENNVRANILAATTSKPVTGKVINIACGESYSLLDLLKTINRILGKNILPSFAPHRDGDVVHSLADISLARNLLEYNVSIGFHEGMKKTVEWYMDHADAWTVNSVHTF